MTASRFLEELVIRLGLSKGRPTLLFLVLPEGLTVERGMDLFRKLLAEEGLRAAVIRGELGPAAWASASHDVPADVYLVPYRPGGRSRLSAQAHLLNAQRQSLQDLNGPLLLILSENDERNLRELAPDFATWAAEKYTVPGGLDVLSEALRPLRSGPAPAAAGAESAPRRELPIRILHLSDLHLKPGKSYDQDRVLRGLLARLKSLRAEQPLDLIFVTGDLSFSGQPKEFVLVSGFLNDLLEVTGVEKEHLFLVPGNHDADRSVGKWLIRTLARDEDSVEFFTSARGRSWHLDKFANYQKKMRSLLGADRTLGLRTGAAAVELVVIRGETVAVASLNSAWFAQDDDDAGKLWLGETSIDQAAQRIAKVAGGVSLAIAVFHHPLDYLHESERSHIEDYLDRSFDLVLRGHLHKDRVRSQRSARGGYLEIAAPAAYQTSRWPNGCFLIEFDSGERTVRVCPYEFGAGADPWTLNSKVFPDGPDPCHRFTLPRKALSESTLFDDIAPLLGDLFLSLDTVERSRLLRDLGMSSGPSIKDEEAEQAYELLRRTGRLGELWDALSGVGWEGLGFRRMMPFAMALAARFQGKYPPLPEPPEVGELLSGFVTFWMGEGQRWLVELRQTTLASELLFEAYLLSRFRPGFGLSPSRGVDFVLYLKAGTPHPFCSFLVRSDASPDGIERWLTTLDRYLNRELPHRAALLLFPRAQAPTEPIVTLQRTPNGHEAWVMTAPMVSMT